MRWRPVVSSLELVSEPSLPPGLSRETTIRRDADGRWFHDGEPVINAAVARAFDRWIDLSEDGRFCLRNRVNWAYVEIEGPPIFVERVRLEGGRAVLSLSDERIEPLDLETVRRDAEGRLYCTVREGRLTAQLGRRAMLDVAEWLDEDGEGVCLRVGEHAVRPPLVDDPLDPRFRARAG